MGGNREMHGFELFGKVERGWPLVQFSSMKPQTSSKEESLFFRLRTTARLQTRERVAKQTGERRDRLGVWFSEVLHGSFRTFLGDPIESPEI